MFAADFQDDPSPAQPYRTVVAVESAAPALRNGAQSLDTLMSVRGDLLIVRHRIRQMLDLCSKIKAPSVKSVPSPLGGV